MRCDKLTLIIGAAGLILLSLIFTFDPTHDFPVYINEIEINPGEIKKVTVPTMTSGFLKWAGGMIKNPYIWSESTVGGIELLDIGKILEKGIQYGISKSFNMTDTAYIRNAGSEKVIARVSFTIAPPPDELSRAKAWWYVIVGIAQTLISTLLAIIRTPGPSIFDRCRTKK